jgi:predicted  nucleic acid-binding Zn-ribbon protein
MNPDLEKLVQLHRIESELGRVEFELAEVPRLRKALADRLDADRGRLEAAKTALETSQKARKQHEVTVQDLEAKRSKYKGQLMEVKTNKEYTAMLHEIEGVEREIRSREDLILEEMEKAETLVQEVRSEEAAFKLVEQEARTERAGLDSREAKLGAETGRLRTDREQMAASVPEDARHLYERVAKLRGTAVAEARDGMCQACRVKLRVQVWVEIRKNEQVFQCESCSRVLFFEPPPPTVAVEP